MIKSLKKIIIILEITIIVLACCSCKSIDLNCAKICFKLNNIKIPKSAKVECVHNCVGGIQGDGDVLYRIELNNKEAKDIEKQVKKKWNKGKLSDEVDSVLYGGIEDAEYINVCNENIKLPKINNGYWQVFSDHIEPLTKNDMDFYFGVYDMKNHILYLFENHV